MIGALFDEKRRKAVRQAIQTGDMNALLKSRGKPGSDPLPPHITKFGPQEQNKLSAELIKAAKKGDTQAAEELIAKGADMNAKDNDGHTVLMGAAVRGNTKIAELLIANGADVNARNNSDDTALMLAALNGHTETAEMLINKGADLDARNNRSDTALTWAALQGYTKTAEMLKKHGATE